MKPVIAVLLMLSPVLSPITWSASAAASEPEDFALRLTVEASAPASLLRVSLPEAVYRAVRRDDLADVRVFNAGGEALPMARLPQPRSGEAAERSVVRPLVALPANTPVDERDLVVIRKDAAPAVQVNLGASASKAATAAGYVLDSQDFNAPIDTLVVHWPGAPVFEAALQVQASDDLMHWQTVMSRAPVLALGSGETRIEQARIDLPAVKARYLRLNWLEGSASVDLERATLIHRTAPDMAREWMALDGQVDGSSIAYVSPGLFPVDAVRLQPRGDNDVQPATLYSRPAVSSRWRWRGAVLGYRLMQDDGVVEAPAHSLAMTRDPLWRAELDAGAAAATPPRLLLGWVPEMVVFVARGEGPYTLAAGNPAADSVWRTPQQVVPDYGNGQTTRVSEARVLPQDDEMQPVPRDSAPWQPGTHWWLWAALASGVVVLGAMARGLWREMRSSASSSTGSSAKEADDT